MEFDPPERDLASRLETDRPLPSAEFRGTLGRYLAANDPGYGPRPQHLRATIALYLLAGAAVMLLGTLQSAGVL